jgi:formylglycine-generating enzyme required for sulfatase activity
MDVDPLLGTTLKGRYVVERGPLGVTGEADRGGWSDVYLARDPSMRDRPVIVKFPKAEDGRERRVAVRQTAEDVATWLPHVALALDAVHASGIVHRDLKPANILFSSDGRTPFLSDFGIARLLEGHGPVSGLTETSLRNALYTAGYESPEFIAGCAADPAYDRYALTVVVHRALTGGLPHWPTGARVEHPYRALAARRAHHAPERVDTVVPSVPAGVASVVAQALAQDPADRFPTATAFADAFRAALATAGDVASAPTGPSAPAAPRAPTPPRRDVGANTDGHRARVPARRRTESPAAPTVGGRRRAVLAACASVGVSGLLLWALVRPAGDVTPGGPAPSNRPRPAAVDPRPADTTPPRLVVTPGDVQVTAASGTVDFRIEAEDDAGVVRVTVDGAPIERSADGVCVFPVAVAEGASRTIVVRAINAAGLEREARRTVTHLPLPWRAPLAAAKAAAATSPPDWESVTEALGRALAAGVPSSEVPRSLERGVEAWTGAATVGFELPGDQQASSAVADVVLRVTTPRDDDVVKVNGVVAGRGAGLVTATVLLKPGATPVVAEVVDIHGRVRASATATWTYFPGRTALAGWAEPVGTSVDPATGLPIWIRRTKDGAEMVLIPAATFSMGAPRAASAADQRAFPPIAVKLSQPYYLDIEEVTIARYAQFVAETKHRTWAEVSPVPVRTAGGSWVRPTWRHADDEHDRLAWEDAVAYARWAGVSLPTSAQWEFAARAGRPPELYAWGDQAIPAQAIGNLNEGDPGEAKGFRDGVAPRRAAPRRFPANGFGCFDLVGNVPEWCLDVAVDVRTLPRELVDPRGPSLGLRHVLRGSDGRTPVQAATLHAWRASGSWGAYWDGDDFGGFRCAATMVKSAAAWRVDDWAPATLVSELERLVARGVDPDVLATVVEPACDRLVARLEAEESTTGVDRLAVAWLRELASLRGRFSGEWPTGRASSMFDVPPEDLRMGVGHPAVRVLGDLKDSKGNPFSWARMEGRVVVLTAWGLWCRPCCSHEQDLRDVLARVGAPGEVVLGVAHVQRGREREDSEADDSEALGWLDAVGLPAFTRLPIDWSSPLLGRTSARSIPHTIVVGRDGVIESVGVRGRALEVAIRRALARRSAARAVARELSARTSEFQDEFAKANRLEPVVQLYGMRFVLIPPGTFLYQGVPVRISRPFYLQTTEVTNQQFRRFRPTHRSGSVGGVSLDADLLPVTNVTPDDAREFASWLTPSLEGKGRFALPTQAQWEYAAKAASTTRFPWGAAWDRGRVRANVRDPAFQRVFGRDEREGVTPSSGDPDAPVDDGFAVAAPVASFSPNDWGLFDVIGNVAEWTEDLPYYDAPGVKRPLSASDPEGSVNSICCSPRGGNWKDGPELLTSAYGHDVCYVVGPGTPVGFRLAIFLEAGKSPR